MIKVCKYQGTRRDFTFDYHLSPPYWLFIPRTPSTRKIFEIHDCDILRLGIHLFC